MTSFNLKYCILAVWKYRDGTQGRQFISVIIVQGRQFILFLFSGLIISIPYPNWWNRSFIILKWLLCLGFLAVLWKNYAVPVVHLNLNANVLLFYTGSQLVKTLKTITQTQFYQKINNFYLYTKLFKMFDKNFIPDLWQYE